MFDCILLHRYGNDLNSDQEENDGWAVDPDGEVANVGEIFISC